MWYRSGRDMVIDAGFYRGEWDDLGDLRDITTEFLLVTNKRFSVWRLDFDTETATKINSQLNTIGFKLIQGRNRTKRNFFIRLGSDYTLDQLHKSSPLFDDEVGKVFGKNRLH